MARDGVIGPFGERIKNPILNFDMFHLVNKTSQKFMTMIFKLYWRIKISNL